MASENTPTEPERIATPSFSAVKATVATSARAAARALRLVVVDDTARDVAFRVVDVEADLGREADVLALLVERADHDLREPLVGAARERHAERDREKRLDLVAGRLEGL